jgi:hypothetical protein
MDCPNCECNDVRLMSSRESTGRLRREGAWRPLRLQTQRWACAYCGFRWSKREKAESGKRKTEAT